MNQLRYISALALAIVLLTAGAGCQSKTDSADQKSVVQRKDTVSSPMSDTIASDTRRP